MGINCRIFVYGTLAGSFLKDTFPGIAQYIRNTKKGRINARLFDLGKYPGAKPTTIKSKEVFGKIYEWDPAHFNNVLLTLDGYEEYNPFNRVESLYTRKIVPVITDNGNVAKAWVYWYNKPVSGKNEIWEGDYKDYLSRKKFNKDGP